MKIRYILGVLVASFAVAGNAAASEPDAEKTSGVSVSKTKSEEVTEAGSEYESVAGTDLQKVSGLSEMYLSDSSKKASKAKKEEKPAAERKYWGQISGSFETNTIYYVEDKATGAILPKDNYGSNNYLKLDYNYKNFSFGIQEEWYPQVLQGYDKDFKGFTLPFVYAGWQNDFMSVTVGDFYEQFGSGLLLRAWEDRYLGLNNSLGGARLTFNIKDIVNIKVFSAVPRKYMYYTPDTWLNGADVSFSLSNAIGLKDHSINIEGSLLHKHEVAEDPEIYMYPAPNTLSFSARANYAWKGLTAGFEYVGKGKDYSIVDGEIKGGSAILAEMGYSRSGFSVNAMFRKLDNMFSPIFRDPYANSYTSNTLNYVPVLAPQHTYSLATIKPYAAEINSEIGGQIDMFYQFKRGTALGGKRGMKIHANFSTYYYNKKVSVGYGDDAKFIKPLTYREVTFDIEKAWSKKFTTTFFYSYQFHVPYVALPDQYEERNTMVLDMLYKFNSTFSLRAELQYLYAPVAPFSHGDWMAALLEFNIAPMWSIYVSDMYNNGETKLHYYNAGVAFTHSVVRAALSYGRNKEGYLCSGGVCRAVPAYTGANLSVTVRF